MKKINFGLIIFLLVAGIFLTFGTSARAAAPLLSLSANTGDNVNISVTGDPNSSVILYFQKSTGGQSLQYLGSTNANGNYSLTLSSATYSIMPSSPVYVTVNSQQSATVTWPYGSTTASGAITFDHTGLVLTSGQSSVINISNLGSGMPYLLSNSNPQNANINISGSQVSIFANTYGQTVFTICVLGTTSNCASAYLTVQNSGAQALTFSQNSLTIAYNQSSTVSILNGSSNTGAYSVLNNSNPSIIAASISGSTLTITANNNAGAATITVCSVDMSSCGIVSASAGTVTSTGLTFSQSAPNLLIGQSLSIGLSGGSNYNISSNSNSSIVSASINNSNNTLNLVANNPGSSVITVCSSAGNCNALTATVGYASANGALALSQTSLWLQVGQSVSITVSGGSMPYSILNTSGNFQATLNNNIVTLVGVTAGSASLNVCSAGGACIPLSVLVNGVSTSNQLTFSNNNLSLSIGDTASVSLYGGSGYYISNSNNQNVAAFTINGDKVAVSALSAGNANVTVCQSGGQCGIIYAAVVSASNNAVIPPAFSPDNPTIGTGQSLNVAISGSASGSYYISSNSNPTIVQVGKANNILTLKGLSKGSSVLVICAASNNCSSLAVTVNSETANPSGSVIDNGSTASSSFDDITNAIGRESINISGGNIGLILSDIQAVRNVKSESSAKAKYLNALIKGQKLTAAQINNLNYFIVYGTPGTVKLGMNERSAVLASYLWTYKKLPITAAQWGDIFNAIFDRLPSTSSLSAENQAKAEFKKIYARVADMKNANDKSTIMIIAYGLRPNRNLASESNAIKTFRSVYKHTPVNILAWNIVRAIAYGGSAK